MNLLTEMDKTAQEDHFRQIGWVTYAAFHEPKLLQDIGDKAGTKLDPDTLPAMLRATS